MWPETATSRNVHVSSNDLLEVGCHAGVRKKVVGDIRREVDEQVHIAIGSVLLSHNGAEDRNVENASLPKFGLVRAKPDENAHEKRHRVVR
jgi:hypothetical protein